MYNAAVTSLSNCHNLVILYIGNYKKMYGCGSLNAIE